MTLVKQNFVVISAILMCLTYCWSPPLAAAQKTAANTQTAGVLLPYKSDADFIDLSTCAIDKTCFLDDTADCRTKYKVGKCAFAATWQIVRSGDGGGGAGGGGAGGGRKYIELELAGYLLDEQSAEMRRRVSRMEAADLRHGYLGVAFVPTRKTSEDDNNNNNDDDASDKTDTNAKLFSDNGHEFFACRPSSKNSKRVEVVAGHGVTNQNTRNLMRTSKAEDLIKDESVSGWAPIGGSFSSKTGRIQCRFRRLADDENKIDQNQPMFDSKTKYDVALVLRSVLDPVANKDSASAANLIGYPYLGIHWSETKASLLPASSFGSQRQSPAFKAHGCFMVLAWVFASSVGIILARYYKDMWPPSRSASASMGGTSLIEVTTVSPNAPRLWFQLHRGFQLACTLLSVIGLIIVLAQMKGKYSGLDTLPGCAHPILGIIVLILAFANPLIALCRCKPNHSDRPWFNWFHFFFGTIAHVLSVPTIMIGLQLPAAGYKLSRMNSPQWIMIFYVIFQFCVEIALEIHGCCYYRRNKEKRQTYLLEVEEFQAEKYRNNNSGPMIKPVEPQPSGRTFRKIMIFLHGTVVFLIAFALVLIIAVN